MSITTGYEQSLQLRVAELIKRHSELIEDQKILDSAFEQLKSRKNETVFDVEELRDAEIVCFNNSAVAASVWDLKCEVEKYLSLYADMKRQNDPAYKIENAANFIKSCIDSCVYDEEKPSSLEKQFDTCQKLIGGLSILFVPCPQLTGQIDSLNLLLFNSRIRNGFQ